MPFDYEEYEEKCNTLTTAELHKEWENYTRQIAGGATSTATSVLFSPFTAGLSLVGLGLSAPRIHNARKKREIIEAGLQSRGTTHSTRKRDVIAPMAVAGTLGGLTLGLAGPGADFIAGEAVGHGIEYAASHVALEATGAALEHGHEEHSKKKADEKLKIQYQYFQQQYVQDQAKLQENPSYTFQQPGLQVNPAAPRLSRPGTPQPEQSYQTQSSDLKLGLSTAPPPPQYSRPGTPQPEKVPRYQAQAQNEQKYEYAPIPAAYSSSIAYRPASHQQQFVQPIAAAQPHENSMPQYRRDEQSERNSAPKSSETNLTTSDYFPQKSTAIPQEVPSHTPAQTTIQPGGHPTHIDLPPAPPSMEEEILFLKARLIQLELEKRGAAAQKSQPAVALPMPQNEADPMTVPASKEEAQPSVTLTPPAFNYTQFAAPLQQYYPPPPASPALPPRRPNAATQQLPPPPPLPHIQTALPPPPPLVQTYAYHPQNYPLPPSSPNPQQQPQYQRHDSGYYSNAPTPAASNRLSQSYLPSPTGYPSPLQDNRVSQHSHTLSINSYQPSPMSSGPPSYVPTNSAVPTGSGKDYFGRGTPPSSPNMGGAQNYQAQSSYGSQGWRWGTPAPVGVQTQFPPPPPSGR